MCMVAPRESSGDCLTRQYLVRMRLAAILLFIATLAAQPAPTAVDAGSSPQIAVDTRGVVRIVYGRKDTAFVVTSRDNGATFGAPAMVGSVAGMHLGNTRGPTIASSRDRSVVMAIDTRGNIHTFELDHRTNRWGRSATTLNDSAGSAPEGLATIAADDADRFFAVWLDLRQNRQNQIYFARMATGSARREPNRLIYQSPDGHVCECCRPTIAIAGKQVAVMFRNWLGGNRDMYLTKSSDAGKTFTAAQKLGDGTWKLDACPMDGGDIVLDASAKIGTAWRRELSIFYAEPGTPEVKVADGRSPMMARGKDRTYLVWQQGSSVKLKAVGASAETVIGEGRLPQVAALRDGEVLVAWEDRGKVFYTRHR